MQKIVFSVFLILLLVPFSQAFSAESTDNLPTLSVVIPENRQFVYLDSDDHAVVVGIVENSNPLTSINNVELKVELLDEFGNIVKTIFGKTTLEAIPPNSMSPFAIRSDTPLPEVKKASVTLAPGFDSTIGKNLGLDVISGDITLDNTLNFSGILKNSSAPSSNTNVYLAFYDKFEPSRILGVSTVELGDVASDEQIEFEFNGTINSDAVGFLLFAESDVFNSNFVDVKIPAPQSLTKLVTISSVSIKDSLGNNLSELKTGSIVNIESETWVQFAADQPSNETPYTYYVQIKESGKSPYVEYIGKYDGRFIGTGVQSQTVDWIPQKSGLFFIETFVWDKNNIPISEQGPFVLIHVK